MIYQLQNLRDTKLGRDMVSRQKVSLLSTFGSIGIPECGGVIPLYLLQLCTSIIHMIIVYVYNSSRFMLSEELPSTFTFSIALRYLRIGGWPLPFTSSTTW
jgi:hypothetical protein